MTKARLLATGERVYHSRGCMLVTSGRIPTELAQLTALAQLTLRWTQLTGVCD